MPGRADRGRRTAGQDIRIYQRGTALMDTPVELGKAQEEKVISTDEALAAVRAAAAINAGFAA